MLSAAFFAASVSDGSGLPEGGPPGGGGVPKSPNSSAIYYLFGIFASSSFTSSLCFFTYSEIIPT